MAGSNQKITGYLKVISPTDSTLITGGPSVNLLRLSRRRDEIVLDLTLRDKKNHYFYDDHNAKFFMSEPCPPCPDGREIEQGCGQDLCDVDPFNPIGGGIGVVTNVSNPGGEDSGGGGGGGFRSPPIFQPPVPPRPRPPEEEEEEEAPEEGCPEGVTRYGRVGDACSEECCFCGDVQHCVEITSYKSGFVVRQCSKEGFDPDGPCAFFDRCVCPICDCTGAACDDVELGDYCYCPCQLTRQQPSVNFEVCETKTVKACWSPGDGLEDNGRMKFSSSDGTTAFLDFETGSFIPGNLGSGLQHSEDNTVEDPDEPGQFDNCPQDQAPIFGPCLLGCGYGEGLDCEPEEVLPPEGNRGGCQSGSTTYYTYACYGILTCPQGTHQSSCARVPRITFSWYKVELGNPSGEYGIPEPQPIGLPSGGPLYSPATDCQTRTSSSCDQQSDGALPPDYQTDFGGILYPPPLGG